jgi:HEAT repeat protein
VRIGTASSPALVSLIRDRSAAPESRADAALILGRLADRQAIDSLAWLLDDERLQLRDAASKALGQMGEPAVEHLLAAARSPLPPTRQAAMQALGSVGTPAAIETLIQSVADPVAAVRSAAVRALGETRSGKAVAPLMSLVQDEESTLRGQAAASLARLGNLALDTLVAALRDSRPSVRVLAAQALGESGLKQAAPALVTLVGSDSSAARGEAIEALGKIGDPSAVDPILAAIEGGSVVVRRKAISALGRLRDRRAVPAFVKALSDRDADVRQAAVIALAEMGDVSLLNKLEDVAENDPSSDVRTSAAVSIERIRSRAGARPQAVKN